MVDVRYGVRNPQRAASVLRWLSTVWARADPDS
jgi:hypothetical protein